MKKVFYVVLAVYVVIAVYVTANMLAYNEYHFAEWGGKVFINLNEDLGNYHKGDMIVVRNRGDYQAGDNVFYCRLKEERCVVSYGRIETMMGGIIINKETISNKFMIGEDTDVRVIPVLGGILNVLESRWGYLCLIVLPILVAFVYELYHISREVKRKKQNMFHKMISFFVRDRNGKLDKQRLFLLYVLIFLLILGSITFARYAYQGLKAYFFQTKKFYFNCDKLSESGSNIEMTNWSGVGQYSITFNMNSYANNLLFSDDNIEYDISYECSDNVTCSVVDDKMNGTIPNNRHTDSFTIIITVPTDTVLHDQDRVELRVETTSTSPYIKKLKGTFALVVGYYGLSYEIDDSKNSPYLTTRITNTLDYYVVREAFDGYLVNHQIDIPTYLSLSNENKAKCASSIITLTFDPTKVLLDMTSQNYQDAVNTTTTTIGGHQYITSISFKIDAMSSEQVKFYKVDTTQNYTYPNIHNNSIIGVSYS